ncbi:MAG: hypothetical protein JNL74_17985 [Fibrobacteres bacterium]|nr:hypothetical protein [Fibrobacterota bacterium]
MKKILSGFAAIAFASFSFLSCESDVVKPDVFVLDSSVFPFAVEAARALHLSTSSFLHNEAIPLDTVAYSPIYTTDFLAKIDFNNTKACWIDSVNNHMPYYNCNPDWHAYAGTLRLLKISATAYNIDNEGIELFFFTPETVTTLTSDSPPVFRKVSGLYSAYVFYTGGYFRSVPQRFTIDDFYCFNFAVTLYPRNSHTEIRRYSESSDSVPLIAGGNGKIIHSRIWEHYRADSAKIRMGLSVTEQADVPIMFMRFAHYSDRITGYVADSLIDSVFYPYGSVLTKRKADSVVVKTGTGGSDIVKLKRSSDNSFSCVWSTGTVESFSAGNGFRNSTKTFNDSSVLSRIISAGTLTARMTTGRSADSIAFAVSQDTLVWNSLIDAENMQGKVYWSQGQVCSKFKHDSSGMTGWAVINPWTGNGKCYVRGEGGIIYTFVVSSDGTVSLIR